MSCIATDAKFTNTNNPDTTAYKKHLLIGVLFFWVARSKMARSLKSKQIAIFTLNNK